MLKKGNKWSIVRDEKSGSLGGKKNRLGKVT